VNFESKIPHRVVTVLPPKPQAAIFLPHWLRRFFGGHSKKNDKKELV